MPDLLRDSVLGQFLNSVSGGRILPYSDQRNGFAVPKHFRADFISRSASRATIVGDATPPGLKKVASAEKSLSDLASPTLDLPSYPETAVTSSAASTRTVVRDSTISAITTAVVDAAECRLRKGVNSNPEEGDAFCEKARDELAVAKLHPEQVSEQDSNLVGWYGASDPDNPRYYDSLPLRQLPDTHRLHLEIGHYSRDLSSLSLFPCLHSQVSYDGSLILSSSTDWFVRSLHRLRHLHFVDPIHDGFVRHISNTSDAWPHIICAGLRHRTHVSGSSSRYAINRPKPSLYRWSCSVPAI